MAHRQRALRHSQGAGVGRGHAHHRAVAQEVGCAVPRLTVRPGQRECCRSPSRPQPLERHQVCLLHLVSLGLCNMTLVHSQVKAGCSRSPSLCPLSCAQ